MNPSTAILRTAFRMAKGSGSMDKEIESEAFIGASPFLPFMFLPLILHAPNLLWELSQCKLYGTTASIL